MKYVYAVLAAAGVEAGLATGANTFEYVHSTVFGVVILILSIAVVHGCWGFLRSYTRNEKIVAFVLAIPIVFAVMYMLFEVVGLEKNSKRSAEEIRPLLEEKILQINEGV